MSRLKRTRVAKNVYQLTGGSYEVIVSITGRKPHTGKFPAGTPLPTMTAYAETKRAELVDDVRAFGELPAHVKRDQRGALEVDAEAWWAQIRGRVGAAADRSHLRAWLALTLPGQDRPLGQWPRRTLTTAHVNTAIACWRTAPSPHTVRKVRVHAYTRTTTPAPAHERSAPATSGAIVALRTIRHRCRVLADLYHTLDGRRAPTPVDDAKVPPLPKPVPVTVPPEVIVAVLIKLATRDPKTHARFAVVATTGQRPCQVGRAQITDLSVKPPAWLVRSAKQEPAHTIPLQPAALAAWKAFAIANAWGPFDTSRYGKILHAAGWPVGVKPYAARHSIAKALIQLGISLGDVQAQLGHTDPATTRTFYAPFEFSRQQTVSAALQDYLIEAFRPRLVKAVQNRVQNDAEQSAKLPTNHMTQPHGASAGNGPDRRGGDSR